LWVGGAHAHAIIPRPDNRVRVTKKMRNMALISALSYKFNEGTVVLLSELVLLQPKTKDLLKILTDLNCAQTKVLLVMPTKNETVEKSAANLPMVGVTEARLLNPIQVLNYKNIILVGNSLEIISERIGV
jgi:large subunit ribosomal protein L4